MPDNAPDFDDELRFRRWPNLDWEALAERTGYQRELFDALFPPEDHPTFDAWRRTTQLYQSHVLKVQIESLRRLKYRPTGGFCFSSLADPGPNVSSAILDHRRSPKDAYEVVRRACAEVIVVADQPPDWINPGDRLRLDLHIVNDRHRPIDDAVVEATATWAGGTRSWRFGGPVGSDEVVKVGTVDFEIPDTLGELAVEILADLGDGTPVTNRYTTAVTLPPD